MSGDKKNAYNILRGKQLGSHRHQWEENINTFIGMSPYWDFTCWDNHFSTIIDFEFTFG
jgi:hypothetical protein